MTLVMPAMASTMGDGPCAVPTALTVGTVGPRGAQVGWTAAAGATGYELQVKRNSEAYGAETIEVSGTSYTFTNLLSNSEYNWRVRAVCSESSQSDWVDGTNFTTPCPATVPVPEGLLSAATVNGAYLTWSGTTTQYQLRVKLATDDNYSGDPYTANETNYTFTGLTPGLSYDYQVRAVCDAASSSWSEWATGSFNTLCPMVTSLAASGETTTGFTLTWTDPGGTTGSYRVERKDLSTEGSDWHSAGQVNTTSHTFTDLRPGTNYLCRVRSICTANSSKWDSITVSTSCDASIDVTTFNTPEMESNSAKLTWVGTAYKYKVNMREHTTPASSWGDEIPVTGFSYRFDGLVPGKQYDFSVVAVCSGTESGDWKTQTATTACNSTGSGTVTLAMTTVRDYTSAIIYWTGTATSFDVQQRVHSASAWSSSDDATAVNHPAAVNSHTFTGLTPGTKYDYRLRTNCGTTHNDWVQSGGLKNYEFITACDTYANADVDDITSTAAVIRWDGKASKYQVQVRLHPSSGDSWDDPLEVDEEVAWNADPTMLKKELSGLISGQTYDYRVRCYYYADAHWTDWAEVEVESFTTDCPGLASAPTASAVTHTGFTVSWSSESGKKYKVQVKEHAHAGWVGEPYEVVATGSESSQAFSGLTPGTQYDYRVWQECPSVGSSPTHGSTVTTNCLSGDITFNAPTIDYNSATVTWNHEATEYKIMLCETDGTTITLFETQSATMTFEELSCGTGYKYKVAYRCGTGDWSSWSEEQSITTLTCPEVSNTGDAEISFQSSTVAWDATPAATSYIIELKENGDGDCNADNDWSDAESIVTTESPYTFRNLKPSTKYKYRVTANNIGATPGPAACFTTEGTAPYVGGSVFGGGRMADVGGDATVTIINCDSLGAVYGGNDIAGNVKGEGGTTVTIGSNTLGKDSENKTCGKISIGSVYGGGNGYYAYKDGTEYKFDSAYSTHGTVTLAPGDIIVNMDWRRHAPLRGGCSLCVPQSATVGWDTAWVNRGSENKIIRFPVVQRTSITVNNELVRIDSLFGGAKNAFVRTFDVSDYDPAIAIPEAENQSADITINGGTIYSVFGGNNFGGEFGSGYKHDIEVNMTTTLYETQSYTMSQSSTMSQSATMGFGREYGIRYLFGGGNKVPGRQVTIAMNGGQVDTLFAGGNSADVASANVTVNCPKGSTLISDAVYRWLTKEGGGDSLAVNRDYKWDGTGVYNIRTLFGGNNAANMSGLPTLNLISGHVGTVYGGGNSGDMLAQSGPVYYEEEIEIPQKLYAVKYGTHVVMEEETMLVDFLYGGCQKSDVNYSTLVEVKGGNVGTVYGGCNISGDVGSKKTRDNIIYPKNSAGEYNEGYEEVRGGTWVDVTGGRIYKNLFAGSNGYYHCNDNVNYVEGIDYDDPEHHYINTVTSVPTHNETHVHLSDDAMVYGNVYAGGNLAHVGFVGDYYTEGYTGVGTFDIEHGSNNYPLQVGLAAVVINGGTVVGNVYGGGNMASIYGLNKIMVRGGEIKGALYGGNDRAGKVADMTDRKFSSIKSKASDGITSLEGYNTYVMVEGNAKIGTVFGGGNGEYDYVNDEVQYCTGGGSIEDIKPIQSNTFVDIHINGGASDAGGHIGTVYGGGDGVTVSGKIAVLLNTVNEAAGYDNVGAIFGGNNQGSLTAIPEIILLKGQVHDVYGGCNKGTMAADSYQEWSSSPYGTQGATMTGMHNVSSFVRLRREYTVGSDVLDVTAVVSGSVFGGCRMSDVEHNSLVIVEGGNHSDVRIFGGNDISGTVGGMSRVVLVNKEEGYPPEVNEIYGGGNGGYTYNKITHTVMLGDSLVATGVDEHPKSIMSRVDLAGGVCHGNVYAGGLAGESGETILWVDGNTQVEGILFGGGRGNEEFIGLCEDTKHHHVGNVRPMALPDGSGMTTGTSTVELYSMAPGSNASSVYGGGHNGDCHNTVLNLHEGFSHRFHAIYGGCYASNVDGTTTVTIDGSDDGSTLTADTVYGGNNYSGLVQNTVLTINGGRFTHVFGAGNGNYYYNKELASRGLGSYDATGNDEVSKPGEGSFTPCADCCYDTVPYSMDVVVNFNGGYYEGSVYGGGNMGLVGNRDMIPSEMTSETAVATREANIGHITVNIHSPSEFGRHVFAGACGMPRMVKRFFTGWGNGEMAADRRVEFDVDGVSGNAQGNIAKGLNVDEQPLGNQLAYAQKIVNMDGGVIHFSLYGGSEAVDDGFPYECIGNKEIYYYGSERLSTTERDNHNSTLRPSSVLNIMGGDVRKSVYGAGYQGNVYGSVYVNIGQEAIDDSPVWSKSYGIGENRFTIGDYKPCLNTPCGTQGATMSKGEAVMLEASVYNASDWGEADDKAYFNTRGVFGGETNILIDGEGYATHFDDPPGTPNMNIAYSVIGAGTSTEGGDVNRLITILNYGEYYQCRSLSRSLFSIQRADKVILDHVYLTLYGEQDAFSAYASPNYAFARIDTLFFRDDNVIAVESPSIYIGNMASIKAGGNVLSLSDNLYDNSVAGELDPVEYDAEPPVVADDLLDNLPYHAAACDNDAAHIQQACDEVDFCDKLPSTRGMAGKPAAVNTLVMRNGSYISVSHFVDDDFGGDNDEYDSYGHVRGWMYIVSESGTQSYVYASDKSLLLNSSDGGFVSLCKCENYGVYDNELDYNSVLDESSHHYRTWRIGTKQGSRTRQITLVANSEPDGTLNFKIPDNSTVHTLLPGGVSGTDNSTTFGAGHHFAYSKATLELPPSTPGNFYVVSSVSVDQDNGNQMQLIDEGFVYDQNRNNWSIFQFPVADQVLNLDNIANPGVGNENLRNYRFGLTFSTTHTGSNFEANDCWLEEGRLDHVTEPERQFYYIGEDNLGNPVKALYNCWPTSIISAIGTGWSQTGGFISRAVKNTAAQGVVPTLEFTLTYDTRLTTTITRDVAFVMDEYTADGEYVGPIHVTVTISTVIRDFSNLEAPVLAMYNEGISNVYSRKVTIPSSFLQRDLYLRGIEWHNACYDITPSTPIGDGSGGMVENQFFLQDTNAPIGRQPGSDDHVDDGITFTGNNMFSIVVSPEESTSENINNHLGWYHIETRNIDVYAAALQDYRASKGINDANWDFNVAGSASNPDDLATFNYKRKYDSYDFDNKCDCEEILPGDNEVTRKEKQACFDKYKSKMSHDGILLGTLDGRSTANLNVQLRFNGEYVYNNHYPEELADITLHLFWKNNKHVLSNAELAAGKTDTGYIDVVIKLRTREAGDTIYVAPEESLTRTAVNSLGGTTPVTVYSCHSTVGHPFTAIDVVTPSHKELIKDRPDFYVQTMKEALTIYDEGDVIDIMETVPIEDGMNTTAIHGDDYSIIQIIRYSGSHYTFPSLGCANRNALFEIKNEGRLNLRNVWINGSGCTRVKEESNDGSGTELTAVGEKYFRRDGNRVKALLYTHAPLVYCHENGSINTNANVLMTNNFNIASDSVWDATEKEWKPNINWIFNEDPGHLATETHIPGGAVAVVRDSKEGILPNIILGNKAHIYDNLVCDWASATRNYVARARDRDVDWDPIFFKEIGEDTIFKYPRGPQNYGGAIFVDGGVVQLGSGKASIDHQISIIASRNFYLHDTAADGAGIITKKRYELGGELKEFEVHNLDTTDHSQYYSLSNIFLTRTPKAALPNPVRRDTKSDNITFLTALTPESRIGVSKWFPGYPYTNTASLWMQNSYPRDTIAIAVDASGNQDIAHHNYVHGVFFNDSSYFSDNSGTARFIKSEDYTLYHNNTVELPAYNDKVFVFHHPNVNNRTIYLQRCASFGKGVTLTPVEVVENGRKVYYNDFVAGDSICFKMNQEATCVSSTDTLYFNVGGGFYPYTYTWYYDKVLNDDPGTLKLKREQIRLRHTDGTNSISRILDDNGDLLSYNYKRRYKAGHDTLVLRSLQFKNNTTRSTYCYYVTATDRTGNCKVSQPVMVRIAQQVVDAGSENSSFYVDSLNFLRHRNPYVAYDEAESGGLYNSSSNPYYTDFAVFDPSRVNPSTSGVYNHTDAMSNNSLETHFWGNYAHKDDTDHPDDYAASLYTDNYMYYRMKSPGVDSSSFHDHVGTFMLDGVGRVFYNSNTNNHKQPGDTLYPFIRKYDGTERSDTLCYFVMKKIEDNRYIFMQNPDGSNEQKIYKDYNLGDDWYETVNAYSDKYNDDNYWITMPTALSTGVFRNIVTPRASDGHFKPVGMVPNYTYNDADNSRGGTRRAGYNHLPMQWYGHGYNVGTLQQRADAAAFVGKPYRDMTKATINASYYNDDAASDVNADLTSEFGSLYGNQFVPRYLRVYKSFTVSPVMEPTSARKDDTWFGANMPNGHFRAFLDDATDFGDAVEDTLKLKDHATDANYDQFCAGTIIKLKPLPKSSGFEFIAWDFDASAPEIATFVVSTNPEKNSPKVYYSPGDYWWQHVTSWPGNDHYERHYNGDVTVKDYQGLAWLISTVNGYNGQNAHTFRNNKVTFAFNTADMGAHKWTPLGNLNNPFEGTIEIADGYSPVVSNVIVNESITPLVGMFGHTLHATIEDFTLQDGIFNGTSYVGALVSHADTGSVIGNMKVQDATIFGEQVLGGIAAKATKATITGNTVSAAFKGSAIYAGAIVGESNGINTIDNNSATLTIDAFSALYLGGMVALCVPQSKVALCVPQSENETQSKEQSDNQTIINNNYVHLVGTGSSHRVGGLVGYAQNVSLNNNYVFGEPAGSDYVGGLLGFAGNNVSVSNCYYVRGMAKKAWGFNDHPSNVQKSTTFRGGGKNVLLSERVEGYSNMLRALNRWVFTHSNDSVNYNTWRSTTRDENGGYPVFGDPEIITVRDSSSLTVCDNIEWDGLLFDESGRYLFHIVDSNDYLDSTFILLLTVNNSDSTVVSDSVTLGSGYDGHGLNLSADELRQLFGNDMSRDVVALRYVDSLLTAHGCDSLVVLTLYVVNNNASIDNSQSSILNSQLKVYPNPTRGIVNVEGEGLLNIEVYDNVSRRVVSKNAVSNHEQFDLSDYPSGIYYIRVRTMNGTVVKKLIKK